MFGIIPIRPALMLPEGKLPLYCGLQHVVTGGRLLRFLGALDLGPAAQPLDHGDLCQEYDPAKTRVGPQPSKIT
ncbi:hypothetical protein SAMN05720473_101418 [Fibrobacter sp. UWB15]|nr:hypothetical protein BGW99_101418 [Fibrobacter sp. UWB6]SHF70489.1 hypothetical protein SAMN05720760_101383 [Fibrobacter sp. UWB8]SMG12188.1 hypothetical protein SAMN05720473_101418 [Fibrobacter sp. UWB15]